MVDRSVRLAGKPFPLAPIHTAIVRVSGLSPDFLLYMLGGEALGTACVLGAGIGLLGQAAACMEPWAGRCFCPYPYTGLNVSVMQWYCLCPMRCVHVH